MLCYHEFDAELENVLRDRAAWESSAAERNAALDVNVEICSIGGVKVERLSCDPTDSLLGVLIWFHGGGFNAGSPRTHRSLVASISSACGIPALVPEYRLAPEYPHPAAIEDAKTVLQGV